MTQFSEGAIGGIVRALFTDRRDLSESLEFWLKNAPRVRLGFDPMPVLAIELRENTTALIELAEGPAPWIKQHKYWPLISNNLPLPRTPKDL